MPVPFGPFDLLAPIGKGAMAVVWKAVHRDRGVPVAVKVMTAPSTHEALYREGFRREARVTAGLNHPGIIAVLDYGEIGLDAEKASRGRLRVGSPALVMALAEGTIADAGLRRSWADVRTILLQILEALAHAHARGVVHRDIKPGNVLQIGSGALRVALADFGLAHLTQKGGESQLWSTASGTPRYMPPEQLRGRWRDFGPWTDLYALGCLAHTLVTGQPPFNGPVLEVVRQHYHDAPPPMTSPFVTPPGLDEWVGRLLEKEPTARFQHAADAAAALRALDQEVVEHRIVRDARSPPGATLSEERPHSRLEGVGLGLYGLREIPLVGRHAERAAIEAALGEVRRTGRAHVVVVRGPAGCGKSRLTEWVATRFAELGEATVLTATFGYREGPANGLGPMVARHLCCVGLRRAETWTRLCEALGSEGFLARGLLELIWPTDERRQDTLPAARFQGRDERHMILMTFFEVLSRRRLVVVRLDDVHWSADALHLARLLLSMQRLAPVPVLLLMTLRGDEQADDWRPLLDQLTLNPATTVLELGALAPDEAAELAGRLLPLEGHLIRQIQERSQGNPLFITALIEDWVERGVLTTGDGGFCLRSDESMRVPDELHDLWLRRVAEVGDRFGPDAVLALEIAAALGLRVEAPEWERACHLSGLVVPPRLVEQLASRGLVREGEGGWVFAHGMLRESMERRALEGERWSHHHQICARVLASSSHPDDSERLAWHLIMAGDPGAAIDPLKIALARHRSHGAIERADRCLAAWHQAMEAASATDPRRAPGYVMSAKMAHVRGDVEQCRSSLRRAWRVIDAHEGMEVTAIEVLLLEAQLDFSAGKIDAGVAAVDRAEELLAGRPSLLQFRARCWVLQAGSHWLRASFSNAARCYEEAERVHREYGAEVAAARCQVLRGNVLFTAGQPEIAALIGRQALAALEALGARDETAMAHNLLGEAARVGGDHDAAEADYRHAAALFDVTRPGYPNIARMNASRILLARGRHAEVAQIVTRCLHDAEAADVAHLVLDCMVMLLVSAGGLGDWRRWDELVDQLDPMPFTDTNAVTCFEQAAEIADMAGELDRAARVWRLADDQRARLSSQLEAPTVEMRTVPSTQPESE